MVTKCSRRSNLINARSVAVFVAATMMISSTTSVSAFLAPQATKKYGVVTATPTITRAITITTTSPSSSSSKTSLSAIIAYDAISDVGFSVAVNKPMGVIFGENAAPYYGLKVEDVEFGLNGGAAGLRLGDQLVAVNGEVVIGDSFDSCMTALRNSQDPVQLTVFRGGVKELYTKIQNRQGFNEQEDDENEIVMDENYESPVKIDMSKYEKDEEPIGIGDVFNAFKKIASKPKKEKEAGSSGGGFLKGLFGGEAIQLDGDDASSTK
eukprot:CAMPEP_0198154504 /NCGR_PEP_ID=MMETSP1443-20131203/68633_1 /TAXON_ID=186043 /ORGANISM="Entomoneis sp., Strain CCMP2396" /LENGTH=265 /DNA_ID=CAMNT_0043821183 /DNA_START=11 /DNA_END=808 /DNA_ORIENTATION=-